MKFKDIKPYEGQLGCSVDALYDYFNNIIYYGILTKPRIIDHELLHMASTIYDENSKDIRYMGFGQDKHNREIGMGLTEAYTELLAKRYFSSEKDDKFVCDSYVVEMTFVNSLEKIVGKKKMMKLYFTADLKGLIEELRKYNDVEKIIEFIKNIDEINNDTLYRDYLSKSEYIKKIKDSISFMILTYSNKLKYEFYTKQIDEEELYKKIIEFVNQLNNYEYKRYGIIYNTFLLDKKDIFKILKNIFGKDQIEFYTIKENSKC